MALLNDQSLRRELGPDEQLLWSGIPAQGIRFRPTDAFAIPFSLLWGGFAIFWESSVFKHGAPFFFTLWGIPFVLTGLYLIIGRFFADAYVRSRTQYGVTDQRVIIISGFMHREVKSLALAGLGDITLSEGAGQRGSIRFGVMPPGASMLGPAWPGMGKRMPPAFDLIDNVRAVYDLIINAQHALRKTMRA